jgi:hypothetical protein
MPYRPPTHELGTLPIRCVEGCGRLVDRHGDRCRTCQLRYQYGQDYTGPVSRPLGNTK